MFFQFAIIKLITVKGFDLALSRAGITSRKVLYNIGR